MGGSSPKRNCHPRVKALSHKAMCYNHLCHKTTKASLFSDRDINTYLQLFGSGYSRESRVGILIVANTLNNDEDYLICANLVTYIVDSAKSRERKSGRLNPEGAKKNGYY